MQYLTSVFTVLVLFNFYHDQFKGLVKQLTGEKDVLERLRNSGG